MRFSILVVFMLVVSLTLTGLATFPVRAQSGENPVLLLSSFSLSPVAIAPGGTAVANVTVTNENPSPLYGATVSFDPTPPLSIVGSGSAFYIGDMNGSTSLKLSVTLGASAAAASGQYALPYTINYQNDTGGLSKYSLTSSGQVYVPVSGNPVRPLLVVSGVSFSPSIITPGIDFTTLVNVTNSGNEESFGSTFTVVPGSNLTLVGTTGVIAIGSLNLGQSELVGIKMAVSPSATTETVPVNFALGYINEFGIPYVSNSSYTVQITATPNLKVGSFTLSTAPLRPGVAGFLGLAMINVGGDRAYDVKMVLTGPLFLGGTATNYLGTIGSGGSESASFYVSVANSTTPGTYTLGLSVTYTDLGGKSYVLNTNYTIAVAPNLSVAPNVSVTNTVMDPPVLNPGASGTLTIFLKNTGNTEATNVVVHIYGGTGIVSTSYFGLGTMEPGSSVTQVVGINVDSKLHPGGYLLTLNVTYADPSGATYSSAAPLQSNVYAAANLFSATSVILVVVLAIVFVAVLFLARILYHKFKAL